MTFVITLAVLLILIGGRLLHKLELGTIGEYAILSAGGVGAVFAISYLQVGVISLTPFDFEASFFYVLIAAVFSSGVIEQGFLLGLTLFAVRFVFERDRTQAAYGAATLAFGTIIGEEFIILYGRTDLGRIFASPAVGLFTLLWSVPLAHGRKMWPIGFALAVLLQGSWHAICLTSVSAENKAVIATISGLLTLMLLQSSQNLTRMVQTKT